MATIAHQKAFFDRLANKLQIQNVEDWHNVPYTTILNEGGSFVTDLYGGSLVKALRASYPSVDNWRKPRVAYWMYVDNQRKFLDDLAIKLNITKPEDWLSVQQRTVFKEGGHFIKRYYQNSLLRALQSVYPEHSDVWQSKRGRGHWKDVTNQRAFLEQLAPKLNIQKPEDWLKVPCTTIVKEGGTFICAYYNSSVSKAMKACFPEHNEIWDSHISRGHWKDINTQRQFFDKLAKRLNLKKPEDWYTVRSSTVVEQGGFFIVRYYNSSLLEALKAVYPEHRWQKYDPFTFRHTSTLQRGSKSQNFLLHTVQSLLPDTTVLANHTFPTKGAQTTDGLKYYEFDVYLPNLAIALEYQGETHYYSTHTYGRASERRRADDLKRKFADQMGITLIPVPFWWNKSPRSLATTIQGYRPDISFNIDKQESAVASAMPLKYQNPAGHYAPTYAKPYNTTVNPTGWLMMEMYDGVRVFWDGRRLVLKKHKMTINVPTECSFPLFPFEGVLWMGTNSTAQCVEFVTAKNDNRDWNKVKIMIYDAPQETDKPYSERLEFLQKNIPQNHRLLSVVQAISCTGGAHVDTFFNQVCRERPDETRAVGIVLRDPSAWYFQRNAFYTKKVVEQAIVMKLESGQFKWSSGKVSSLQLPTMKNRFGVVAFPPGHPEQAHFASNVISKEELYSEFFHYYVAKPPASKRCAVCHQRGQDLCIQTEVLWNAVHVKLGFCLNDSCLPQWLRQKSPEARYYKPFNNIIWAKEKDLEHVKRTLSKSNCTIEVIPPLNEL